MCCQVLFSFCISKLRRKIFQVWFFFVFLFSPMHWLTQFFLYLLSAVLYFIQYSAVVKCFNFANKLFCHTITTRKKQVIVFLFSKVKYNVFQYISDKHNKIQRFPLSLSAFLSSIIKHFISIFYAEINTIEVQIYW